MIMIYKFVAMGTLKMSYIGYDMNFMKMILWSRWLYPPLIFEEIDSRNEMR